MLAELRLGHSPRLWSKDCSFCENYAFAGILPSRGDTLATCLLGLMGSCSSQSVQKSRKERKVMTGVHRCADELREEERVASWQSGQSAST